MDATPSTRTFTPLEQAGTLDSLLAAPGPFVIFKHSPTCGTSAFAYDQLLDFLDDPSGTPIHLVNVLAARPLSQQIAARLGVRHESPQVLVVDRGQVRWHASHFRVTADALRRALASLRQP